MAGIGDFLFDRDQVLDVLFRYPALWLLVAVLGVFVVYRKYRLMKRRIGHIDDGKSWAMLALGFVGAAVAIGLFLAYG